ncbi:hypothetical protein DERF_014945 [Dermatophagoides farinae]|uniref:Uncharacterized protein n=1 Tax=Dermatophagoides farinae TaxID=6954 RepID=A0A922KXP8_DERFA|nr:hypothetical protein DERF_014945 [Dermatophagoides farinae]
MFRKANCVDCLKEYICSYTNGHGTLFAPGLSTNGSSRLVGPNIAFVSRLKEPEFLSTKSIEIPIGTLIVCGLAISSGASDGEAKVEFFDDPFAIAIGCDIETGANNCGWNADTTGTIVAAITGTIAVTGLVEAIKVGVGFGATGIGAEIVALATRDNDDC